MFEGNYQEEDDGESDHEDESETAESREEFEQRLYRYRGCLLISIAFDTNKISFSLHYVMFRLLGRLESP